MIGSVAAEENLLTNVEKLTKHKGVSVGLIIGQVSSQKCFVIHFAPTPEQSKETSVASIKEVDETRLGEHARYVTRMLPGGLWVLGVCAVTHDEVFTSSNTASLRRILAAVDKSTAEGFRLHGRNPSGQCLLFHYNASTKKYLAKSFDRNLSDGFKNVDWKFQSTTGTWCEISTEFYLKETFLETSPRVTFHQHLENLLSRVAKDVDELRVCLQGKEWESSSHLDSVLKAGGDNSDRKIAAALYRPCRKEGSGEMRVAESSVQLRVKGCLPSRVFLHPRTTVQEATAAVKQDIVRSLASRLEMHWDSLVDEEDGSPEERERVHEPPRRILLRPIGWKLLVADFLFPGEVTDQAVRSCKELLDLDVDLDHIEDRFEVPAEAESMLSSSLPVVEETDGKSLAPLPMSLIVLAAIFLACLALFVHFLLA